MRNKGNVVLTVILLGVLALVVLKIDFITDFAVKLINSKPTVILPEKNQYARDRNYYFVQKTDNFIPYSRQDLINLFYSYLDNGYDNLTFYCPEEYEECIEDITTIINDQSLITDIGNYVHPFNNFHDIYLTTSSSGEVNIKITKTYDDEERDKINKKIDEIFNEIFKDKVELKDKILALHDYIVDQTTYDEFGKDDTNAYDLFFSGKTKCFGYADAMAIILDRLNVPNFKVGSSTHVWNAVYIDDEWTHIDATWDDPVVINGGSISKAIRHKFYMIDTKTLLSYDTDEHGFDQTVYVELKQKSNT